MREMIVTGISIDPDTKSPIMLLRVKGENLILPIWIGPMEAGAISVGINRVPMPRPLTHDLMLTIMHSLNVTLTAARITAVRNGTFYGEIDVLAHGVTLTIDCRPSDAVALALRAQAPVYAEDEVIKAAGRDVHESGLLESETLLLQDNLFSEIQDLRVTTPDNGQSESGSTKTVVLSESESEEFLGKLLRALEPESKYKM